MSVAPQPAHGRRTSTEHGQSRAGATPARPARLAITILLVLHGADLEAQDRIRIDDPPRCSSCELTVERTAVIYDRGGAAGMSPPAPQDVLRTSSGHLVVTTTNPSEPLLFDQTGGFIGRLGRRGEGPGEFRSPRSVVQGAGDTVWILDSGLQRRTAWSPEGEYLGEEHRTPGLLVEAAELSDGSWVFSGARPTAGSVGLPLHRAGTDGNVTLSFGPEAEIDPTGHPPIWMRRNLTTAADGHLWSASSHAYRLEKYDSRGHLLTVLERDADWFPARDPSEPRRLAEDGPREAFVGLVENDEGIVKTLVGLPGENWREGLGERELQPGFEDAGVYWTPVRDYDAVYRFAIEVIDTRRGELLYRERYDGAALGWVDADHFATYDQDEHDIPIIEIHRVEFRDAR